MPPKTPQTHNPVSPANMDGMTKTPQSRKLTDGSIRWRIFYRRPDGSQTSQGFEDYESAERWAALIDKVGIVEALSVLPSWQGERKVHVSLEQFALEHVDLLTDVSDLYRTRCRRIIANDLGVLGALPLDAVTEDSIAKWVNGMRERGLAGKTIKNKHGFLSSVFKRAVRRKLVAANPCEGTAIPRTVTEEMVILTPDEFARFIGYFTPHWRPFVALLYGSGLRFSEATALTVGDVDVASLRVSVTKAWKDNGKVLGPPKTSKSRRNASISLETVRALEPLLEGRAPGDRLFLNQRGGTVRSQTFHDNAWDPAVRLANGEPGQRPGPKSKRVARRRDASGDLIEPAAVPLGKRPRVHDLRHSHASWLLHSGVPINYVQAQLGHEDISTTVGTYGHLVPGAGAAISAALSGALSGAYPEVES